MIRPLSALLYCALFVAGSFGAGCAPRELSFSGFVAPPVVTTQEDDVAQLLLEVARPGARIETRVGGAPTISGSAVAVGRYLDEVILLTADHVVSNAAQLGDIATVFARPSTGATSYIARIVARNPERDLATLAVKDDGAWSELAPLAADGSYYLRRCVAYGHPGGILTGWLTEGRVQAEYADGRRGVSPLMFSGNSGGAIYVSINGRYHVVGLAQRLFTVGDGTMLNHVGLISALAPCRELLKTSIQVMSVKGD